MREDLSAFPLVDQAIIADLQEVMVDQFPGLVAMLIHEITVQLTGIQTAVAQGDAGQLYRIAHRLKSGAGSMGAAQLADWRDAWKPRDTPAIWRILHHCWNRADLAPRRRSKLFRPCWMPELLSFWSHHPCISLRRRASP